MKKHLKGTGTNNNNTNNNLKGTGTNNNLKGTRTNNNLFKNSNIQNERITATKYTSAG
jgi:hypothetical protein